MANAQNVSRQGHSTGTILSNRSENITVITPYEERRAQTRKSASMFMREPTSKRWMHRTTINFNLESPDPDASTFYKTSSKSAFAGSKTLPAGMRSGRCPTLHASHFDINMSDKRYFGTFYKKSFSDKLVEHPSSLRYPALINRSHSLVGSDMQAVLTRKGNKLNYWSSYAETHSRLGLQRGEGIQRPSKPMRKYHVLSGEDLGTESIRDLHRISGNRILHKRRQGAEEGFVLG
ncbi:uncharacterized protein LOC117100070 [Anneissia japonica]|uniref:uncharacterized protein LOC117100070 n=1 Tax=Anneissia japonica TaxID=1529436 RepID=UPI001425ACDB|nr:uncharacterized protein LOC117100070 [Anneissia japonica]